MSKILALDLGDQWIGVALSDIHHIVARPYTTVTIDELDTFLLKAVKENDVDRIIIGYPLTMKGGMSDQTLKILAHKEKLVEKFPHIQFILWDERLSSQRAQSLRSAKQAAKQSKEEKLKSHALAAAFILDSYLQFLKVSQELSEQQ